MQFVTMTLGDLKRQTDGHIVAELPVQVAAISAAQTKTGKPFFDLELVDSSGSARLKIWSDSPGFEFCERLRAGDFCKIEGEFFINDYGLNINRPAFSTMDDDAVMTFVAGSPERAAELDALWMELNAVFDGLADARLRLLATTCLREHEAKWRRAAAARAYHHARRGGLLEHTNQMLRAARALAPLYPEVWADLLFCGILFHDLGKCWENDYPARGFNPQPSRMGELLGHISIGVEVVNRLWNRLREEHPDVFGVEAKPANDLVREYLLHLIISHHGQMDFGSPVTPKIPEAWMLHYIDNLDAKMQMLRESYADGTEVGNGLFKAQRPLSGYLARPLASFIESSEPKERLQSPPLSDSDSGEGELDPKDQNH